MFTFGTTGSVIEVLPTKRYEITRETSKGDVRRFTATIDWVEDRGDFFYIGYTPDDFRICRFGALKVKKNGKYKAINYSFKRA